VATTWTISNWTSSWNGKRIRIDRVEKSGSVQNLLARDLSAQDRYPEENVATTVNENLATFRYQGATIGSGPMSLPAIATYRVTANRAVREAPVALTRAGFIGEWLDMKESDAANWGERGAARAHSIAAADFKRQSFQWTHIAACDGSPMIFEVGARIKGSGREYVFRISGSRSTDLRMLTVTHDWDPTCRAGSGNGLEIITVELNTSERRDARRPDLREEQRVVAAHWRYQW
jgi:hypothetical protein